MALSAPPGHASRFTPPISALGTIAGSGAYAISGSGGMGGSGCKLAPQPSDDLAGRNNLPGVTLSMFGRMEEQAEHVAGQVGAANGARGQELVLRNVFQAAYRVTECHVDKG